CRVRQLGCASAGNAGWPLRSPILRLRRCCTLTTVWFALSAEYSSFGGRVFLTGPAAVSPSVRAPVRLAEWSPGGQGRTGRGRCRGERDHCHLPGSGERTLVGGGLLELAWITASTGMFSTGCLGSSVVTTSVFSTMPGSQPPM